MMGSEASASLALDPAVEAGGRALNDAKFIQLVAVDHLGDL